MALATYDLLPPPETIQVELGEERKTTRGGIHVAFGPVSTWRTIPEVKITINIYAEKPAQTIFGIR